MEEFITTLESIWKTKLGQHYGVSCNRARYILLKIIYLSRGHDVCSKDNAGHWVFRLSTWQPSRPYIHLHENLQTTINISHLNKMGNSFWRLKHNPLIYSNHFLTIIFLDGNISPKKQQAVW